MGKTFGNVRNGNDLGTKYPDLPRGLLKIIYEGEGLQISRRANGYVVFITGSVFFAGADSLSKWLSNNWGELSPTQMGTANKLLGKRIKAAIIGLENENRLNENRDELQEFFGR